jgi:hypothetical protein
MLQPSVTQYNSLLNISTVTNIDFIKALVHSETPPPPNGDSTSLQKVVHFNLNSKGKIGLTLPLTNALVYGLCIDFNY